MKSDKEYDRVALGESLRRVRKRAGKTQAAVAAAIQRTPAYVSQVESGKIDPSVDGLLGICRALAVSIEDVLADEAPAPIWRVPMLGTAFIDTGVTGIPMLAHVFQDPHAMQVLRATALRDGLFEPVMHPNASSWFGLYAADEVELGGWNFGHGARCLFEPTEADSVPADDSLVLAEDVSTGRCRVGQLKHTNGVVALWPITTGKAVYIIDGAPWTLRARLVDLRLPLGDQRLPPFNEMVGKLIRAFEATIAIKAQWLEDQKAQAELKRSDE